MVRICDIQSACAISMSSTVLLVGRQHRIPVRMHFLAASYCPIAHTLVSEGLGLPDPLPTGPPAFKGTFGQAFLGLLGEGQLDFA